MKKLAITTILALGVAAPALADSVHNETAQRIFDQIKAESGTGGGTK